MSSEPSSPADMPEVAESVASKPRRSSSAMAQRKGRAPPKKSGSKRTKAKRIDWNKVKVFEEPAYRLPFRLAMYTNGPHKGKNGAFIPPPLWLQVAIESGLVEMGSPGKASQGGALLEPIGSHPPARMKSGELDRMITEGLAKTLDKLSKS